MLSLGLSAGSHSAAVGKECHFLRRSHQIAAQSPTYDLFREAYLQSIANFQLLRRVTNYYAIEVSGETDREKHAAQNTFILLGWPAEWNEAGEIVYYPASDRDNANCIKIRISSTNQIRVHLIETSASLKYNSRTKSAVEKRLSLFNETFHQEFKKWGFVVRDPDEPFWPELAQKMSLSPYWSRSEAGSYDLRYRTTTELEVRDN